LNTAFGREKLVAVSDCSLFVHQLS